MDDFEDHFVGKVALKVIVEKAGKVLLIQDPRSPRDIWELPGGRMNINEDPREAMKREFLEELGTPIEVGDVVHMEQFIQGDEGKQAFVIVFAATLENDAFNPSPVEISKVEWFSKEDIADLTLFPEYQHAVDSYFIEK